MKDKIHTAPVKEAFESGDECPFCCLQRETEHRALRYVAGPGASYMEPEVRGITNQLGFCPEHMQKLYDYGNPLGVSLMLQTYFETILDELAESEPQVKREKKRLFWKKQPEDGDQTLYWDGLDKKIQDCYICRRVSDSMERYYATFFHLTKEAEFRASVDSCKGFCLEHLVRLMERTRKLPDGQKEWFYGVVLPRNKENLQRVKADLDWFIAKHDYRNAKSDWGNSQDALSRAMQKLAGIYPADKPYRGE